MTSQGAEGGSRRRRARAIGRGVRWALFSVGMVCMFAAAGLSGYANTAAGRLECGQSVCAEVTRAASVLCWSVVGAVAVTVFALAAVRRRGRGRGLGAAVVRGFAGAAGLALWIGYVRAHLGARRWEALDYSQLRAGSMQMWIVTPAVCLAVAGLLAAAIAFSARLPSPGRWGVVAIVIAVAVGSAVTVMVTMPALAHGRVGASLDATTAAVAPIPPLPAALGGTVFEQRFTSRLVGVASAGAGYVIYLDGEASRGAVEAYDSTGHERWHFKLVGPQQQARISDVAVYEHGSVVVVAVQSTYLHVLVGLDALTGAQLWSSSDRTLTAAYGSPKTGRSVSLVARDDQHWTAFDPRTGRQKWQVRNPTSCAPSPRQPLGASLAGQPRTTEFMLDSDTQVASIVDCSTAQDVNLKIVALDPATGATLISRVLDLPHHFAPSEVEGWVAHRGGEHSVAISFLLRHHDGWVLQYLDYGTGQRADLGYEDWEFVAGPAGDFLTRSRDGVTITVRATDGAPRCTFVLPKPYSMPLAWLGGQIVMADSRVIHAFDTTTCRDVAQQPQPQMDGEQFQYFRTVAGAVLLVLDDEVHTAEIIGYNSR